MANLGSWNTNMPSGTSLQRDFDDLYRSDKSTLHGALNEEHYFESASSASAAFHRPGSAAPYYGATSALSTVSKPGVRFFYDTTTRLLHAISSSSTDAIRGAGDALVGVRAYRSGSDFVTSSASTTKVVFNSVSTNPGGGYDTSTGIYTPPSAGYYRVTYAPRLMGESNGVPALSLYKGSTLHTERFFWQTSLVSQSFEVSDRIYCNGTTDTIYPAAFAPASVVTVMTGETRSYLIIEKVGE